MIIRLVYFLSIALVCILCPWWVIPLVCLPYFYFYTAYELLIVALLVDGYFGAFGNVPVLSMMIGGIFIVIEGFKPYVSFRTH
jgi:hypothetical protein